ncbi:unnamed protein product, partial [Chrysoparadoxa australica]
MEAAAASQTDCAKVLLMNGADVTRGEEEGLTAIHYAAAAGSLPMVNLLLDYGADCDARSVHGQTPLMHCQAVWRNSVIAEQAVALAEAEGEEIGPPVPEGARKAVMEALADRSSRNERWRSRRLVLLLLWRLGKNQGVGLWTGAGDVGSTKLRRLMQWLVARP